MQGFSCNHKKSKLFYAACFLFYCQAELVEAGFDKLSLTAVKLLLEFKRQVPVCFVE